MSGFKISTGMCNTENIGQFNCWPEMGSPSLCTISFVNYYAITTTCKSFDCRGRTRQMLRLFLITSRTRQSIHPAHSAILQSLFILLVACSHGGGGKQRNQEDHIFLSIFINSAPCVFQIFQLKSRLLGKNLASSNMIQKAILIYQTGGCSSINKVIRQKLILWESYS